MNTSLKSPPFSFPPVLVITGLPGAGKSYIANQFELLGATRLDADTYAKQALHESEYLKKKLPADCFQSDGSYDRTRLRTYLLQNRPVREMLESTLHPEVMKLFENALQESTKTPLVVYELPLLFEKNITHPSFSKSLCVTAPLPLITERLLKRGLSREEAEALLSLHLPQEKKAALADFVIENEGQPEVLALQVKKLFQLMICPSSPDPTQSGETSAKRSGFHSR